MILRWRDVSDHTEPVCLEDSFDLSRLAEEHSQIAQIDPAHVAVCASIHDQMCTIQGQMDTRITYYCSRCLTPTVQLVAVAVVERFVQDPDKVDEDDDQVHLVSDAIELDPYLEQAAVLAISYRPLCSDSCQGLCPVCGINKNVQTCTCDTRRVDPRLADLAKFFQQDE
ncbi:DUF177 domain-containing protein [Fodinisporobacter ferrooxydans]|uniref:DUF177 domain-containing protein n=1 Tax=Fodinisporobacter ferrooxydans TaxID=2901836 RepID=A0ABY4CMY5_9BACL|nr:DUF177 domain-containing protein [Alicyclobacillaceae bacterium MYW30-H2]